jgi:hypothetical protein
VVASCELGNESSGFHTIFLIILTLFKRLCSVDVVTAVGTIDYMHSFCISSV